MGEAGVEFVRLTGQPRATRASDEISFVPDKRFQLLSYLAFDSGWVGRERAAFLFWPDSDTESSRRNLRGLIQRLRTLPFEPGIEANKHQLRWSVPTDVQIFNQALEQGDVGRAIEAYSGPLLDGLESDDAGEFGEWLEIAREELRSRWRSLALARLGDVSPGDERGAESLLRRLLDADPLDEEAVRAYLVAMARIGRPTPARVVYQEFATRLERELGLEPTSDTVAAYERLTAASAREADRERVAATPSQLQTPETKARKAPGLPRPSTTFIGRVQEQSEVSLRLLDPACRLLTVVGPGGVGKTRLSIAVARDVESEFSDGAAFVPLDAIVSADDLVNSVARAIDLKLPANAGLGELTQSLADRNLLLVLDNCEHLHGLAGPVKTLLDECAGVKLLATSRERLALEEEWLYQLEGLQYPAGDSVDELMEFPSTMLFLERARRVSPRFEVSQDDWPWLVRLVAYTEGLPLAIELAAAWVRSLPLSEIVFGLEANLDLLTSTSVDSLPRHVSMRAAFEQSWSLLTETERVVLRRLSIFESAVTAEAALFVVGASRPVLAALVDKSLLRLGADARFHRHPLLLLFAKEKMASEPEELTAVTRRHASYYLRFLRERTDAARGTEPVKALDEVDHELPEILAAVGAAVERGKEAQLIAFMRLLAVDTGYLHARGFGSRSLELLRLAASAATRTGAWEAAHLLTGRLADAHGPLMGDARRAMALYRQAAELAARADNLGRQAVYTSMVGNMARRLGNIDADEQLDEALAMAERSTDEFSIATVLEHRALSLLERGENEASRNVYERSLKLVDQLERSQLADAYEVRRARFFCLINLGEAELRLDRPGEAMAARQSALAIANESGNTIWIAYASHELGEMHMLIGESALALEHLGRALALYQENHVTAHLDRLKKFVRKHGLTAHLDLVIT